MHCPGRSHRRWALLRRIEDRRLRSKALSLIGCGEAFASEASASGAFASVVEEQQVSLQWPATGVSGLVFWMGLASIVVAEGHMICSQTKSA